ncbi:hypothetical protein LV457_01555 [Mycobacterium sp. MYCO198283]|uniref:hypothetical protein n=1 Tax=Mycobacterium sp. MYCO198283 TaxID=2883505 RepID=UPI001E29FB69|nr:hypothetical protein [Mycobacterium sp. MYCO198283]MCG5430983.1 hypothetical protein [Mycobacterium sp. MYCO198283]
MAKHEGLARRAKKVGIAGAGAFAISAALLGLGAGTASADELTPDPSKPVSHPAPEGNVRASGSAERSATQGDERKSDIALPKGTPVAVQASAPNPGNLSDVGIDCVVNGFTSCG